MVQLGVRGVVHRPALGPLTHSTQQLAQARLASSPDNSVQQQVLVSDREQRSIMVNELNNGDLAAEQWLTTGNISESLSANAYSLHVG